MKKLQFYGAKQCAVARSQEIDLYADRRATDEALANLVVGLAETYHSYHQHFRDHQRTARRQPKAHTGNDLV